MQAVTNSLTSKFPLLLCLSGGGFRGYFSALVLAAVEKALGTRCNRVFDLIAGTSVGGIVALGLAYGVPAQEIAENIAEHGQAIFPRYPLPTIRRLLGAPYKSAPVGHAIKRLLPSHHGNPLSSSTTPVMVVAVSPMTARLVVISSWDKGATANMSTLDAALATSAAPSYFAAHRARTGIQSTSVDLIDGGIAANAPDALAIHEAVYCLGFAEGQIGMLSVGTCAAAQGGTGTVNPAVFGVPGTLIRLGGRGIVNLMMAMQETRGVAEARVRLGQDRYLRLDRSPSDLQAPLLRLDNASEEARKTLEELAAAVEAELRGLGTHGVWRALLARAQYERM